MATDARVRCGEAATDSTSKSQHNRHMRFARLQCESEGTPVGLNELVTPEQLDFIQLDYSRPRMAPIEGRAVAELSECALGFADATRALIKTLFLDPDLRVVTSAGWSDAYGTVEHAAAVLVEGGCGELPMSAVRGSNLLPILEMLVAEHVDLKNSKTGAPWHELQDPILAADLQLGAGPIATALAEQARIVVAGCFDQASPTTAAAVLQLGWSWDDRDSLAASALAAHAAAWCDWQPEGTELPISPWLPSRVELDETGRSLVNVTSDADAAARRLQEHLRSSSVSNGSLAHADVRLDSSRVFCRTKGPRQVAVDGAVGARTDGCWKLEVLYQAGYVAEAMIEFAETSNAQTRRHLAGVARAHLQPPDAGGLLIVEPLQSMRDSGVGWLHVAYQSKSREACKYFADQTVRLATAHRPLIRLASGPPRLHVHCGVWHARVPRDAVDIAVETRLAKEWI